MSEENKGLVVFVDDLREPRLHLGKERAKGVVLIKTYGEAIDYFEAHEAEITEVHLDEYLGHDPIHLGSNLLEMIYQMLHYDDKFQLLRTVYLHSSDTGTIDFLIQVWGIHFEEHGVTIVDNHKPGF